LQYYYIVIRELQALEPLSFVHTAIMPLLF